MNLDLYLAARHLAQPLDVVGFHGTRKDPISGLVELATDSPYSHVGVIRQPYRPQDEQHPDVELIECTLLAGTGKNGVQTNPLGVRLQHYQSGSSVWLFRLNDAARKRVDYSGQKAFWDLCGRSDGFIGYSVPGLFNFLLPRWIGMRFPRVPGAVCSIWAATCLETAGATIGIDARHMTPADVAQLPIFQEPIRIL